MNYIYSSNSYHLTFFTEESKSKVLQAFIQVCTTRGYAFSVTPYGVTSVAVSRIQENALLRLFEEFFPKDKRQESMVLNANTESPAFVPYNPTFSLDLTPYIAKGQVVKNGVSPVEVLHFLDLHEDMTWGFVEKVLSLPSHLGKQVFLPGKILTRFKIDTYFDNLEAITPYLGKNGYFQYLYKTEAGKTAFCKRYYQGEDTSADEVQPTHRGQVPSPEVYVAVKPMWYDFEYK